MIFLNHFFPTLDLELSTSAIPERLRQKASILALFTTVFVLCNIIYFVPCPRIFYYGGMSLILIFVIINSGKSKINIEMFILYSACMISLLCNDTPYLFQSNLRFCLFIGMTIIISSAISSLFLALYRLTLLKYLLASLCLIVLVSFLGRFLGFSHSHTNGVWCGILNHSMNFGPTCGIVAIFLLYKLLLDNNNSKRTIFIYFLISLLGLIGASSRVAILGTIGGLALLIVSMGMRKLKFLKYFLLLLVAIVISSSTWEPLWQQVMEKNKHSETISIDSREKMWKQRIREFKSNPLSGIGFGSVDINATSGSIYSLDGKVETGSSWLIILSMTGIFGGIGFFLILYNVFYKYSTIKNKKIKALFISLLFFLFFEMCAEGFIFSAGSYMFFLIWLILGIFDSYHVVEQNYLCNNNDFEKKIVPFVVGAKNTP